MQHLILSWIIVLLNTVKYFLDILYIKAFYTWKCYKCNASSILQYLFKVLKTFSDGEYFPTSWFIFNIFLN